MRGAIAILSYPLACILSVLVEYAGARFLFRRAPFRRLFRCVAFANLASYIVPGALVAVFLNL